MSYTVEQVETLRSAIARGARTLKQNGEEVTYESMAEMRKQLAIMERSLGLSQRVTHFQPGYNRGI